MEYKVSEKVQKKFDTLTKDAKVQKALQFMEEDQDTVIDKQIELTLIPAPTNHEQKKAARLLEMFKEEGLTDCHIDEYGNCVGIRKGTGGGKTLWKATWIRYSRLTRSLRSSVKTVLSSARASWMTQEDVRRSSQQSVR